MKVRLGDDDLDVFGTFDMMILSRRRHFLLGLSGATGYVLEDTSI
jgi:hypothetical protein